MRPKTLIPAALLVLLIQGASATSGSSLHQTGTELSSAQSDIFEKLRADVAEDLMISFARHRDYQVWKDHPAYVGIGFRDGNRIATYSLRTFTRAGGLLKLQNRLREIYNDENIRVEGLQSGLTWGEGMTALQVLFEAGKMGLIPQIQGGGLSGLDGRLMVRLYDMKDAEQTVAVLTSIGVDPELVDFEVDPLEGKSALNIFTAEEFSKKTGH